MMQIFPDIKNGFVLARRAFTGWERMIVPGEGGPMSEGAVFLVVEQM